MKKPIRTGLFGLLVVVVAALAFINAASSGGSGTARSKLTLIAPAAPGGGWDGFAREAQQALRGGGIVNSPQVVNIPGRRRDHRTESVCPGRPVGRTPCWSPAG